MRQFLTSDNWLLRPDFTRLHRESMCCRRWFPRPCTVRMLPHVHAMSALVSSLRVRRRSVFGPTHTPIALRGLRRSDASVLHALLTSDDVARFLPPPPDTVAGFERFIAWTRRQKRAGYQVSLGVTVGGHNQLVGLFQVRAVDRSFRTAEWGFALGSAFWSTGVFEAAAAMVLAVAFDEIGVERLEARTAMGNGRGAAALRKVGALQEGTLRRAFHRNGQYHDQALWAILADDWHAARSGSSQSTPTSTLAAVHAAR
jgi:RimJ/RimL family protein N-acetyltransferase